MKLYPHLQRTVDLQLERINNNFASAIIIDGGIGQGKTTLAVQIVDHINNRLGLPILDLSKPRKYIPQYAIGGEEFKKKMRECYDQKLPVIIYDEGGDFSKRGAMSKFNKFLNRIFEVYRALKIIVIIVLPTMNALDSYFFENKIPRILLHAYGRDKNRTYFKAYSLNQMLRLRFYMRKFENKSAPYKFVQPNFIGNFYNLDPLRAEQLHKVSIEGKLDILGRESDTESEGYLTINQIATQLNRSNIWVRKIFKKIGVNEPHKISNFRNHRKGLYKEEIIKQLQGFKNDKWG